jgi:hypothetical protein
VDITVGVRAAGMIGLRVGVDVDGCFSGVVVTSGAGPVVWQATRKIASQTTRTEVDR